MAEVHRVSKIGSLGKKLVKFVAEVRNELKKVIWPTWEQLVNNTVTVLLACLVIGAIIWLADYGLTVLLKFTLAQ